MVPNLTDILQQTPNTLIDVAKLPPDATRWLQEMGFEHSVALSLSSISAMIVISLGFMQIRYIRAFVANANVQSDLYYLSILFPLISLCSIFGMYMPRCARFMFTVCTTYLMVCLFIVVSLMRDLFGSRAALCDFLTSWDQKISFQAPPLCCCCPCLPRIRPTERKLRRIERLVLQSPVVRITLEILNVVWFLEQAAYQQAYVTMQVISNISFLVALYGCFILMRLVREKLRPYQFFPIFIFVNLTQMILTLQREIIYFGRNLLFSTARQPHTQAYFWNGFATTVEMFLMQCFATYLLSPQRCALFNDTTVPKSATRADTQNESEPLKNHTDDQ